MKPEKVYVRERGTFSGFTLAAARKLAESIAVEPVKITADGDRTRIRAALKLPDAGSLAPLLMDWDEEKLNALPSADQRKILAAIDRLSRSGTIKTIQGEEEFALVKEDKAWRLALDWDAALRVSFASVVPADGALEAEPIPQGNRRQIQRTVPHQLSGQQSLRQSSAHPHHPQGRATRAQGISGHYRMRAAPAHLRPCGATGGVFDDLLGARRSARERAQVQYHL